MTPAKPPRGWPPVPDCSTLSGLRHTWRARDQRYALRKWPLRPAELAIVRAWRAAEALDVIPADIDAALAEARRWLPPWMGGHSVLTP